MTPDDAAEGHAKSRLLLPLTAFGGVVIVFGFLLWLTASDGSKEASLGSGLVTAGLLGFVFLLLERSLSKLDRDLHEVQRSVGMAASPEPAKDEAPVESPRPLGATPEIDSFAVEVDGWARDSSRVDAEQLRLRVYQNGEYFQFFAAVVPGVAMATLHGPRASGVTLKQFRRALADLAVERIRKEVADGTAPLDDPTVAIEVFPDVDKAVEAARYKENVELEMGDVISSW